MPKNPTPETLSDNTAVGKLFQYIEQACHAHIQEHMQITDSMISTLAQITSEVSQALEQGQKIWIISHPPFHNTGVYAETLLSYSQKRPALPAIHLKSSLQPSQWEVCGNRGDVCWMLGAPPPHTDPHYYAQTLGQQGALFVGFGAGNWHFPDPLLRYEPGYVLHIPTLHPLRMQEIVLWSMHAMVEGIEQHLFGQSSFEPDLAQQEKDAAPCHTFS